MCHGEIGTCVFWKPKSKHGPLLKYATRISQPIWLGVGIEDPSGVVEIQVDSWGTLEKISTYTSSHKHMHMHTRFFFILFVFLLLQAEKSPMRFKVNMKKTYPASMWPHAMAMKGIYSKPGHA